MKTPQPAGSQESPDDETVIASLRLALEAGKLRLSEVQLHSGVRIVDPQLAVSRWLAELANPGWIGGVARDQLVRFGRAWLGGILDA